MKKGSFLAGVLLISTMLLLVSCAQPGATTTEPAATAPVTTAPTTAAPATTSPAVEQPKYGGVINIALSADILQFDEVFGWHPGAHTLKLTNEELLAGDWARGPAGTNEFDWAIRGIGRMDTKTGSLAESWEIPERGTIIFKIRKGVRFALYPASEASRLVGGRELTAEDVVYTLRMYTSNPRAHLFTSAPELRGADITAPDKWTVVVKVAPAAFTSALLRFTDFASIVPREVVERYGGMQDWRVSVGTGAYILTDFVPSSAATLVKNPNYWGKDPIGPGKGNQLPYLDGVKYLIILDASTREAALRTAKVDLQLSTDWEAANALMKTTPGLLYKKHVQDTTPNNTHMRTDKAPFNDKRVRRALFMATDFEALKKDLFGGDAEILTWPLTPVREYRTAYLPLEEAPASVQELYKYNPEKAKALLAEAGYPKGFKTTIIVTNRPERIDYYSVIKAMWAKVGIDLTIDAREAAVWESITGARSYDAMIHSHTGPCGTVYLCINYMGVGRTNGSYVDDPYVVEMHAKMQEAIAKSEAEADRIHKELMKYVLDQAWVIPTPLPPLYHIWWPWVKNYRGELSIGYDNTYHFVKFVWIDQQLKEKMTGRK